MDCGPPGSSVHGILQASILEWVAISSSRGSFQPRDWSCISCIAGRFLTVWNTREAHINIFVFYSMSDHSVVEGFFFSFVSLVLLLLLFFLSVLNSLCTCIFRVLVEVMFVWHLSVKVFWGSFLVSSSRGYFISSAKRLRTTKIALCLFRAYESV